MQILKQLQLQDIETFLFSLLILFLPTQLGRHFWPEFSIINGIRVDYLSPTIYLTDVLILVLFAIWILRKIKGGLFRQRKIHRSILVYSLFIVYLLINIFLSGNVEGGFYSLYKFIEFSFVAFYTASIIQHKFGIQRFTMLLAIGVIGESLLAIAHYLTQGSLGGPLYFLGERTFTASTPGIANASINGELIMRPYGTFSHPNVLAGFLTVCMTLIFFFLYQSIDRHKKALAGASVLLGTIALLLTLSRIAIIVWITFLAAVLLWQIIAAKKEKQRRSIGILSGVIILLILGLGIFWQTLTPRFSQTAFTEEALVQRTVLNTAAWSMIADNMLFGVGIGNFLKSLSFVNAPLSIGHYFQPVHNIFLLVFAEIGLAGFLFFLGIIVAAYRRLLQTITVQNPDSRSALAILIALIMILILGLFDHYWLTLQQGQVLFAIVLGLSFHRESSSFKLGTAKNTQKSK